MSAAPPAALPDQLRRLRLEGAFAKARALIRSQPDFAKSQALQRLLYEHEDFWWEPIVGKRVTLRRRNVSDAHFVRSCWGDAQFMRRFNRLARPLPAEDAALHGILAREHATILSESKSLHWTIHVPSGPIGFISVTDYAAGHRRCEFLIGLLGRAASPAPVEAAHLAVRFLRDRAHIERLTAYFYEENTYAARVAEKFGFEREGVLKGYIRDEAGNRADLHVSGMLLTDVRETRVKKVRERLIAPCRGPASQ